MNVRDAKSALRQQALAARGKVTPAERAVGGAEAGRRLVALLAERTPSAPGEPLTVLTYSTHGEEFPAEPVVEALLTAAGAAGWAVRVLYPRVAGLHDLTLHECPPTELVAGYRGIMEPPQCSAEVDPSEIDVVLVPGVAFDESAMRLGYGKGFYDRALALMPRALKVGLSFDETVFDVVPSEPHDHPLDAVLTPTRTISV